MATVTLDLSEIMTRWMKLYMNLQIIRSKNPNVEAHLNAMKTKTAEYHTYMMSFFDTLGVEPEEL